MYFVVCCSVHGIHTIFVCIFTLHTVQTRVHYTHSIIVVAHRRRRHHPCQAMECVFVCRQASVQQYNNMKHTLNHKHLLSNGRDIRSTVALYSQDSTCRAVVCTIVIKHINLPNVVVVQYHILYHFY